MKALVTGGGGFVGGRIARMLADRGDQVTVVGRNHHPHVEAWGVRSIPADVCDRPALRRAFAGVEVVFHVAARVGIWGPKESFWDVNVRGTENVVAACREAGVGRLVYTSSPSVVFGEQELCGVDESQPYPRRYLAAYPESKAAAEQAVLRANGQHLLTVSLRPHLVWGPGDPHLIPRVIERARRGRLVQVGDGQNLVDISYIDNVAEAHLSAADALTPASPCAGKAYFISQGEPVRLWPWLSDILRSVGAPAATRRISYQTARAVGGLMEVAWSVLRLRSEPRMTRFLASQLAKSHYFNISAARRDFGYVPRIPTAEGLKRLIASLT